MRNDLAIGAGPQVTGRQPGGPVQGSAGDRRNGTLRVAAGPSDARWRARRGAPPGSLRPALGARLAIALLLLAAVAGGCKESDPWPCVEGVEPGDTLAVTLLENYDEETTFRYDLATFFGIDSDVASLFEACQFGHDLALGATLTVDVLKWYVEEDGKSCNRLALTVDDTAQATFGDANTVSFFWPAGGLPMGTAQHPFALVDGCERSWAAYFLVRSADGVGPFDAAVPGELPPVLMMRDIWPTDDACSYSEEANTCLFVVQLEKEGG